MEKVGAVRYGKQEGINRWIIDYLNRCDIGKTAAICRHTGTWVITKIGPDLFRLQHVKKADSL